MRINSQISRIEESTCRQTQMQVCPWSRCWRWRDRTGKKNHFSNGGVGTPGVSSPSGGSGWSLWSGITRLGGHWWPTTYLAAAFSSPVMWEWRDLRGGSLWRAAPLRRRTATPSLVHDPCSVASSRESGWWRRKSKEAESCACQGPGILHNSLSSCSSVVPSAFPPMHPAYLF